MWGTAPKLEKAGVAVAAMQLSLIEIKIGQTHSLLGILLTETDEDELGNLSSAKGHSGPGALMD